MTGPTLIRVAAFLLVCILEAVAGFLLWGGYKFGAVLALVLLPTCTLETYLLP